MQVAELYRHQAGQDASEANGGQQPVISFEFFPPKTDGGYRSLARTVLDLKPLGPAFVSVTMGAGGSTRTKTVDLVSQIQREMGITSVCHLPCVGSEKVEIAGILDRLVADGLSNVLALGGDPPKEADDYRPPADGFTYANELVEFIRSQPERWPVSIGGGCYPEKHPRAESIEADVVNLKRKVDAGTDFLVTQLFFDNADYFSFADRCRVAGVDVPIVPGIMPIVSAANIRRMASLSGARIPDELSAELTRVEDDDARTAEVGVEWATMQCRELIERGVPGIHFYTLNRSPATRRIHDALFETPR